MIDSLTAAAAHDSSMATPATTRIAGRQAIDAEGTSMIFARTVLTAILCTAIAPLVMAGSIVETFEGGSNEGSWTFGTGNEVIEPNGFESGDTTAWSATVP